MNGVLLVAPHADDECLFACYQLIRLKAKVLVCLDSGLIRCLEMEDAMDVLGRDWSMLRVPEEKPDWMAVREGIASEVRQAGTVIAPAFEEGGHEHHNQVARIVNSFGHTHIIRYLTYRRGQGRSQDGIEIDGSMVERDLKLAALQCYQSQWIDPDTAPWFPGGAYSTYLEWIA
jgi:LmbE family N-acetylglucosaminyl deacetylase